MEERLKSCLDATHSTEYIFPFFWQHGEDHAVLLEELNAIYNCGITQFCVESRPHEHFCEEQWWGDLAFLLAEAKKRDMKVWVLDDKKFPTGYANNYIETHPELRAVRLRMECRDFVGPQKETAIIPVPIAEDESFVTIVAYRRNQNGNQLSGEGISLTDNVKDGLIWWDIPQGIWRVYYIIRTLKPAVEAKRNYIDMMSFESCKAMIHGVYEPHYTHFKEYFGNTLIGFFSDEAGFANEIGHYNSVLGREGVLLPWNDQMVGQIARKTGLSEERVSNLLPVLWHETDAYTPAIREAYMDAASDAFKKNFSEQFGTWCREHGVMYTGHIIEDQNAHQRLGHGAGHFFKAMDGQDIAGCDIVLHQMIPGMMELDHCACLEEKRADPEFFLYTLPKLASSHAHIQPLKKGRAVCEIFGGFGWAEGIWQMKQMADLMLVSGINYFVPHAFDPLFPDWDHPPHFYAKGMNVQYPVFKQLIGYMQRMSHLLSGGVHKANVAVYYNAEAEWAGGKCMLQQQVCKHLCQRQIDFDILPQETICEYAKVQHNRLVVHQESYGALVVPYSQYLPVSVVDTLVKLAEEGLPIWFVEDYPDGTTMGTSADALRAFGSKVTLDMLSAALAQEGHKAIRTCKEYPYLRTFHIQRDGWDTFMIWNEDIFTEVDTQVYLPVSGKAVLYDVWNNKLYGAQQVDNEVRVRLAPAQSIVICIGPWDKDFPEYDYQDGAAEALSLCWNVTVKEAGKSEFEAVAMEGLQNLAKQMPSFNGTIRYDTVWHTNTPEKFRYLEIEHIGEPAVLWINGEYCQTVVSAPYRFEIADKLNCGENKLRIEVYSNLSYRERDFVSTFLPLQPLGLMGTVTAR